MDVSEAGGEPKARGEVGGGLRAEPMGGSQPLPRLPRDAKAEQVPTLPGGGRRCTHPCGQPLRTGQVGTAALPR